MTEITHENSNYTIKENLDGFKGFSKTPTGNVSHEGRDYLLLNLEKRKSPLTSIAQGIGTIVATPFLLLSLQFSTLKKCWKETFAPLSQKNLIAISPDANDLTSYLFIAEKLKNSSPSAPSNIHEIRANLSYLQKNVAKSTHELARNAELLEKTINALTYPPSLNIINDEGLKSISDDLIKCSKASRSQSKKLSYKKAEDVPVLERIEKNGEACKRLQKFIKIGMPVRHLNSPEINKLLFNQHIYERMMALGHELKLDVKGNPLFPHQQRIPLSKKDILPVNREKLETEFLQKKQSGAPYPLNTYTDGRKGFSFKTYENVSLEEYERHIMIENIQSVFCINEGTIAKSTARIVEDGQFKTLDGSFSEDFWDAEDMLAQFLLPDGQLRDSDVHIEFPQEHLSIQDLKKRNILSSDGSISGNNIQYLGNGFVEHSIFRWKNLVPTRVLPPEQRPSKHTLDVISSFKGKTLGNITGHSYIKITTPEGEVYTLGLSTTKQSLDAHQAVISSPDERYFTPKSSFTEVTGRYTLPDQKAFTKLVQYIEKIQGYHEDERGNPNTSTMMYQNLTENCPAFAHMIQDYSVKNVGAERVPLSEPETIKLNRFQLTGEKIKSWFIHTGISLAARASLRCGSIKDKNLFGFKLGGLSQGISVGGYENYGSIQDRIKRNQLNIYLPRDLAIQTLWDRPRSVAVA
ncbi:MAG: hypothetical protein ACI8RA_002340 [Chlamydiales bacterium]|jgi:hypothetical protein